MSVSRAIVPAGPITQRILLVRGERVIMDADLAHVYGVPTKRLNEQVRRNGARFPVDFMFRLTAAEKAEVVANCGHLSNLRFSKALPLAFTEHGAIMAASVLNSPRAVELSVFVVRAFVAIRRAIAANKTLSLKIAQLERRLTDHDEQILVLVRAIKELAAPPPASPKRKIGFRP
ncbi:MAG: ORF6N domain-containing protein [Candidatus Eisenbacteria bacterium]|nr:ORF6N domain-containing protein [Candidatus Eisenbacteria bacterium]